VCVLILLQVDSRCYSRATGLKSPRFLVQIALKQASPEYARKVFGEMPMRI
jgi:hypothetical protein